MIEHTKEKIKEKNMVVSKDRVLLGVSGGADSLCLAELFYRLKEELEIEIGIMHCHHGLRGETADRDAVFVEDYCKKRNIPFYIERKDVKAMAFELHMTVEEAGRKFRYDSFLKVMEEEGYHKLALAHHANDRAETMLFHLARGTGPAGMASMKPVRNLGENCRVIRPLLWATREEIEDWLMKEGISWCHDESNDEIIYTRNQIRKNVLPALTSVNERALRHMGEFADETEELMDFVREASDELEKKALVKYDPAEKKIVLSIPVLEKSHTYLRREVIYRNLCKLAGGKKDVERNHVDKIMRLIQGPSGKKLCLLRNVRAVREYDSLFLLIEKEEDVIKDREEVLDQMSVTIRTYPYDGFEISKNNCTKYFDCDKIKVKPCLRFWEEGDYLYLREDGGKKLLSRYFIDQKIPPAKRKTMPVLADDHHIMWILGGRISGYYKVTDRTETIMEVTIRDKR